MTHGQDTEKKFIANNSTMVRILYIFITTLAAVSPVAHAGVCVPGLQYCGSTLKDYGKEPAQAGPLVEIDKDRDVPANILHSRL